MGVHQPASEARKAKRGYRGLARPADSFGLVILLLVLDYIAVSAVFVSEWGRVIIIILLGTTLLFALHTSRSRRIWQLLAVFYLVASTLLTLASIVAPGAHDLSPQITIVGGLLLIITPVAILRRIGTHRVVTTETVLGAVCVYLLIGFSFAFIYLAIGYFSGTPFFGSQVQATANDYLFFSYTTLTTVGYGNLVPVSSLGQTFAMLEALFGQIYLVIIVARLVSLWGQERPTPTSQHAQNHDGAEPPGEPRDSTP